MATSAAPLRPRAGAGDRGAGRVDPIHGAQSSEVAQAERNLGALSMNLGDHAAAVRHYTRALDIEEHLIDPTPNGIAQGHAGSGRHCRSSASTTRDTSTWIAPSPSREAPPDASRCRVPAEGSHAWSTRARIDRGSAGRRGAVVAIYEAIEAAPGRARCGSARARRAAVVHPRPTRASARAAESRVRRLPRGRPERGRGPRAGGGVADQARTSTARRHDRERGLTSGRVTRRLTEHQAARAARYTPRPARAPYPELARASSTIATPAADRCPRARAPACTAQRAVVDLVDRGLRRDRIREHRSRLRESLELDQRDPESRPDARQELARVSRTDAQHDRSLQVTHRGFPITRVDSHLAERARDGDELGRRRGRVGLERSQDRLETSLRRNVVAGVHRQEREVRRGRLGLSMLRSEQSLEHGVGSFEPRTRELGLTIVSSTLASMAKVDAVSVCSSPNTARVISHAAVQCCFAGRARPTRINTRRSGVRGAGVQVSVANDLARQRQARARVGQRRDVLPDP